MEKLIKIKVLAKTHEKDGRKFKSYFSPVMIKVEGMGDELQSKGITVKFCKEAKEKAKAGYFFCTPEQFSAPYVYKVTKNAKTGKDEYPTIFIKDFVDYKPLPANNSTCVFIDDEEEIEETELEEVEE